MVSGYDLNVVARETPRDIQSEKKGERGEKIFCKQHLTHIYIFIVSLLPVLLIR